MAAANDSCRLFQPHQPHLRHAERLLHDQDVPSHDGGPTVRSRITGVPALQPAHGSPRLAGLSTFGRMRTTPSTSRPLACPRLSTWTCSCRGSRIKSTTRTSSRRMWVRPPLAPFAMRDLSGIALTPHACAHAGQPFPKTFRQICANIFKRLTRVFCHVYIHHFEKISGAPSAVRCGRRSGPLTHCSRVQRSVQRPTLTPASSTFTASAWSSSWWTARSLSRWCVRPGRKAHSRHLR